MHCFHSGKPVVETSRGVSTDEPGIEQFAVHYSVNGEGLPGTMAGQVNKDINQKTNGKWIWSADKPNLSEVNGDKVFYWCWIKYKGLGYPVTGLTKIVKGELHLGGKVKSCI